MSQSRLADSLVVTYMSESHYHRRGPLRPDSLPDRPHDGADGQD